jgi:PAS domain S-box-containing protein
VADKPLKVLVVDNHPLFLESIRNILSSPEYEVRTAEGGLEAIDVLESFKPQIFFIDLIMPYIDGNKLSRYIRVQEEFANSFIVILSGIAKESDKIEIPAHTDAFIAKGPLKLMAGHIFDVIDQYRQKKREKHPESCLGLNEISPRHITKELLFSVKHLEVLLENMHEGIIEVSRDNRIVYINPAAAGILGLEEFTMLSRRLSEVFSDEDSRFLRSVLEDFDKGEVINDMIIPLKGKFVRTSIHGIADGSVEAKIIFLGDVTSFKEKEAGLEKALGEKEMLIREVHHRVKNNLNIISGLVTIQTELIEDEQSRDILREIQPRLQSISLVHDRLYKTEDLRNIDLKLYLGELASLLLGMLSSREFNINLEVKIPSITLVTDITVSLGLICAELITNAVKYGFYKDNPEQNLLVLSFEETEEECFLSISNNGHPFPDALELDKGSRLGFQVVNLLVDQISGRLELEKEKGTKFSIIFPKP